MIELPVLIENIIEIVNVAIEMMLVFLYFSLLSKAKVNKAVLYLSYLLSTVILSATVLLTDNILVYLITTIILISSMSFICYDDSIRHKIFWNILFLLIDCQVKCNKINEKIYKALRWEYENQGVYGDDY